MSLTGLESIRNETNEQQFEYLRKNLKQEDLNGVDLLIEESRKTFRKHSHHLEAIFAVLSEAPDELNMKRVEESVIAYLKEQGVSASWITMTKGAVKLKRMIRTHREWYRDNEAEILLGLESEKAYLASRMTIEGQKSLCQIHLTKGAVSLREARSHLKRNQFDPASMWKDQSKGGKRIKTGNENVHGLGTPKRAVPREVLDLINHLGIILEGLSEHIQVWEKDPRVHSMVDRSQLIDITKKLCVGWQDNPYAIEDESQWTGFYDF